MAEWSMARGVSLTILAGVVGVAAAFAISLLAFGGQATAAAVPPTHVGMNLPTPIYWLPDRSFTNLAVYGVPKYQVGKSPLQPTARNHIGPDGWPANIEGDTNIGFLLLTPVDLKRGTPMRCTWKGGGQLNVWDSGQMTASRPGEVDFVVKDGGLLETKASGGRKANIIVAITNVPPNQPMTDVDCREQSRPRDQTFDPAFVRSLAPYRVVRFMDWMNANNKSFVAFEPQTRPTGMHAPDAMVSLADMLKLVGETRIDPWFTLPYDASDDFIRRYAKMVHDRLPAGRTVYAELGNEVWHTGFFSGRQAQADGLAAGLTKNGWEAHLLQYAVRSRNMHAIWTSVFADRPKALVRVVSSNWEDPWVTERILGFRDTASMVDAVAIAPYFGNRIVPPGGNGMTADNDDQSFSLIDRAVDEVLDQSRKQKVVADKYQKRLIAYEAGQHLVRGWDGSVTGRLNHDPRMGAAYTKLLNGWARDIGDVIVLYNQTGPGWGLEDYPGQPLAEAPKKKAVLDFVATHPAH
jgi:hypothetical protein